MDPRPSSKTTAPRHRPAAAPGGGGDDDEGTAIPTTAWWMDVLGEWLAGNGDVPAPFHGSESAGCSSL